MPAAMFLQACALYLVALCPGWCRHDRRQTRVRRVMIVILGVYTSKARPRLTRVMAGCLDLRVQGPRRVLVNLTSRVRIEHTISAS